MSVRILIVDGPIDATAQTALDPHTAGVAGAVLTFEGRVRALEAGQPIAALKYTAYEPMATRQMQLIAQQLADELGLTEFTVLHSRGLVPVGACSLHIQVLAPHRKQALDALARFIDQLKQDVPIWKSPILAES